MIKIKRVYNGLGKNDGYRFLVHRLWPRGVSKCFFTLCDNGHSTYTCTRNERYIKEYRLIISTIWSVRINISVAFTNSFKYICKISHPIKNDLYEKSS